MKVGKTPGTNCVQLSVIQYIDDKNVIPDKWLLLIFINDIPDLIAACMSDIFNLMNYESDSIHNVTNITHVSFQGTM